MATAKTIHVLDKRVQLKQPEDGFITSIDAVLLAAACPAKPGDHILDLGCGVGSAGLCVLTRTPELQLTGIDIQNDHVALARANAKLNKLDKRATFQTSDIRAYDGGRFDHVICNPPYLEAGHHSPSPKKKRATALGHTHYDIHLKDWIEAAHKHLKSGGSFCLIHRADHVDKIIIALGKRFGATEIIPLWPKTGVAAKRVIIRTIKDRKTPAKIHAGITLHKNDGSYTRAAENILRRMTPVL